MKFTKPQERVIKEMLQLQKSVRNIGGVYEFRADYFNRRTIDKLVKLGVIKRVIRSRLRADDNEMVYWSVIVLTSPVLEMME